MNLAQYLVIPEAGNPHGYFLMDREKGVKLYVKKVFEDGSQTAFNYQFFYLDTRGHALGKAAYKAFCYRKGINQADHTRIATWFLTRYFSYRDLHFCFPEHSVPGTGGYYPVLGRHRAKDVPEPLAAGFTYQRQANGQPSKEMFELQWD